jgi:hypothetical protein
LASSGLYYRIFLTRRTGQSALPREIIDTEEFVKISDRATECRVKRLQNIVRLKLRTARHLYTIKVDPEKAAEMLKQIRCEVIEA